MRAGIAGSPFVLAGLRPSLGAGNKISLKTPQYETGQERFSSPVRCPVKRRRCTQSHDHEPADLDLGRLEELGRPQHLPACGRKTEIVFTARPATGIANAATGDRSAAAVAAAAVAAAVSAAAVAAAGIAAATVAAAGIPAATVAAAGISAAAIAATGEPPPPFPPPPLPPPPLPPPPLPPPPPPGEPRPPIPTPTPTAAVTPGPTPIAAPAPALTRRWPTLTPNPVPARTRPVCQGPLRPLP